MSRRYESTYGRRVVRLEPATGLCMALFRVLPKSPDRPTLDVAYQLSDRVVLRFSAREALGMAEQTLLFVLLEIASQQYAAEGDSALLLPSDEREVHAKLWAGLHQNSGGTAGQTLMVSTTWEEINRRCGTRNGGSTIEVRRECLRRLCEVAVWEEESGQRRRTRQSFLLFWMVGDDRRIHVALNQRLTLVFFGGQYAKVSLAERFSLRQDVQMAMHAFLSTSVRPGHQLVIGLDTLAKRLWPLEVAPAPPGTVRRRLLDVA